MNQNEVLNVNQLADESNGLEAALRPGSLDEFVGQDKLKDNLRIFIEAAKSRGESLDHCLFYSPRAWVKPPWPIFYRAKWA